MNDPHTASEWDERTPDLHENPYDEAAQAVRDTEYHRPPYFLRGAAFAAWWKMAYTTTRPDAPTRPNTEPADLSSETWRD